MVTNKAYFQQDRAPPHFGSNDEEYLNEIFPERWIGRKGHTDWLARSPDQTPLDFYFRGHFKSMMYCTKPTRVTELENRIQVAVANISSKMAQNTISFVMTRSFTVFKNIQGIR